MRHYHPQRASRKMGVVVVGDDADLGSYNWSLPLESSEKKETVMAGLPPHIEHCVRVWWLSSTAWLIGYFILGALGVALPAVIASGLIESLIWTKVLALTASGASGLQLFLRCDLRADKFHVAWRYLVTAKMRYEHQGNFQISEVINAYDKGEQVIESAFAPVEPPGSENPPHSN